MIRKTKRRNGLNLRYLISKYRTKTMHLKVNTMSMLSGMRIKKFYYSQTSDSLYYIRRIWKLLGRSNTHHSSRA